MRLIRLVEQGEVKVHQIRPVHKDRISVGMSSYDVDLDESRDRVHLRVLQNGLDVGEAIYENGEMVWIHVEPFFRRQGVGRAMVGYLREQGYSVPLPDARTPDGVAFFGRLDESGDLDQENN